MIFIGKTNTKNTNKYTLKDDYTLLHITSLTHGKFEIKLDLEDVDRCKKYVWCIQRRFRKKGDKVHFYVVNGKVGMLSRFILNITDKNKFVDHINGDTLDNRKSNLQICTNAENVRKGRKRSDNTSGKAGICWYKKTNKWVAYIYLNCKRKHLGYYDDKEEAIKVRQKAEKQYFGKFVPIDS